MTALAQLRPAVDAFFDKVTVNADDPALRANRLRLLSRLREATRTVADFSRDQRLSAMPASAKDPPLKPAPLKGILFDKDGTLIDFDRPGARRPSR